jgi:tetratricopeptide (TPR) repeat protein
MYCQAWFGLGAGALRRPAAVGGRPKWSRVSSFAALVVFVLAGCASYSEHTKEARSALDAGDADKALKLYNERLEVESAKELPKKVGGDNTLMILERSMILQQLQQYALSSRDMEIADKQIEILDFDRKAIDDIGKYLFSDSTGPYKAPFYEKLLINTENMLNYLQVKDLNGARIEARRLAVMQSFISNHEGQGASLIGPGSYLAGFIFEKSGDPQGALRYYDEALQFGAFNSLTPVVVRLGALAGYRTPRITKILDANAGAPAGPEEPAELLIVVNNGRVPAKIAKRVPIGLALTYASAFISPAQASQANELALQGLVTWINYPVLDKEKKVSAPLVTVDGRQQPVELALAVDSEARKAWEDAQGAVVASAITRMIARVLAGQVAKKAGGDSTVGMLLSLGTQVALTANDIPDTRSWGTLPARIAVARLVLEPGRHEVEVSVSGSVRRQTVELEPGGWAVVGVTALR